MKIIAISDSDKFKGFRIGEDATSSRWYKAGSKVEKFFKTLKKGDEVKISFAKGEDGKSELTFIQKVKNENVPAPEDIDYDPSAEESPKAVVSASVATVAPQRTNTYGKSPEEQEVIIRQSVGNMASRSLISLQGHINLDNIKETIQELYDYYYLLVKKNNV